MSCLNDTPFESDNQVAYTNDPDEFGDSFYKISSKNESGCFTDYFDNLSNADNLPCLENLQMTDIINSSNVCYWKERRKVPKFLHEYYLLGDTIGKGSYGKVKDCVDVRTMKRYAIKIVHRMKIKKIPGGMKHVESEINLMKTLSHKNIVKIIDEFQEWEPERRCLVMEFCLGSIHDLQTNGILESSNQFRCLPEWQTRHYFSQIIDGLEYLHDQGLIHKDMKPGNFLLTEHDSVKITDFGVSERLEMFQSNTFISGGQTTPAIQPPELAIGAPNICGYKLDIYGTGVSLYFMLCGRVPFSNPNILLIFDEIASGEYTIPDWVSDPASDLIRNMMRKDVNERFDIQNIKAHSWYLNPCEKTGAKIDPMVYLNYGLRDRNKENMYRLSTGMLSDETLNGEEIPAIMPITVVSRLRAYYNWPMSEEEENAEMDDRLIVGEDFIGMDMNTYDTDFIARDTPAKFCDDQPGFTPAPEIRFFIQPGERNDSNYRNVHAKEAQEWPLAMSQSTSSPLSDHQEDIITHNTIPKAGSSSRSTLNPDNKNSHKSKLKFGRKIPNRCLQS